MQTSFGVEFSQKSQDFTQGEKLAKVCLCLHSVFTWTFDGNFQEIHVTLARISSYLAKNVSAFGHELLVKSLSSNFGLHVSHLKFNKLAVK